MGKGKEVGKKKKFERNKMNKGIKKLWENRIFKGFGFISFVLQEWESQEAFHYFYWAKSSVKHYFLVSCRNQGVLLLEEKCKSQIIHRSYFISNGISVRNCDFQAKPKWMKIVLFFQNLHGYSCIAIEVSHIAVDFYSSHMEYTGFK